MSIVCNSLIFVTQYNFTFDNSTNVISGSASQMGSSNWEFEAFNKYGKSMKAILHITTTYRKPSSITYPQDKYVLVRGEYADITPTIDGSGATVRIVSGNDNLLLQVGLIFTTYTGQIAGTAYALLPETLFQIEAYNSDGASPIFNLTISVVASNCTEQGGFPSTRPGETALLPCTNDPEYFEKWTCGTDGQWVGQPDRNDCGYNPPISITYTPSTLELQYNYPIKPIIPVVVGRVIYYNISDEDVLLSWGIYYNKNTGILYGSPNVTEESRRSFSVYACNNAGCVNSYLYISVSFDAPSYVEISELNQVFYLYEYVQTVEPIVDTYINNYILDKENDLRGYNLTFDANTGVISGYPNRVFEIELQIAAINVIGMSPTTTFNLKVVLENCPATEDGWESTSPGDTAEKQCTGGDTTQNELRKCSEKGQWENVNYVNCYGEAPVCDNIETITITLGEYIETSRPTCTNEVTGFNTTDINRLTEYNLEFNSESGIIYGTPKIITSADGVTFTFWAFNDGGNSPSIQFIFIVNPAGPSIAYIPGEYTFIVGEEVTMDPPHHKSVVDLYVIERGENILTNIGLSLDTTSGVIIGTPTSTLPLTVITIIARNQALFSKSVDIKVTVVNSNDRCVTNSGWSSTYVGQTLYKECEDGKTGTLSRMCSYDDNNRATWSNVIDTCNDHPADDPEDGKAVLVVLFTMTLPSGTEISSRDIYYLQNSIAEYYGVTGDIVQLLFNGRRRILQTTESYNVDCRIVMSKTQAASVEDKIPTTSVDSLTQVLQSASNSVFFYAEVTTVSRKDIKISDVDPTILEEDDGEMSDGLFYGLIAGGCAIVVIILIIMICVICRACKKNQAASGSKVKTVKQKKRLTKI